jgi:hypothetical protein
MSLAKRDWRPLAADGVGYFWRASGTDDGISVVVVTADAFAPGRRGQQLGFLVDYPTVVSPGVVRRAVDYAVRARPPFTGRAGEADVRLANPLARVLARDEPRDALLAALESLAGIIRADPSRPGMDWSIADRLMEIAAAIELAPALRDDPEVQTWYDRTQAPDRANAARVLADAARAALGRDRRYWQWGCWYRSALEVLFALAASDGAGAATDVRDLDRRLRALPAETRRSPWVTALPASHDWWAAAE